MTLHLSATVSAVSSPRNPSTTVWLTVEQANDRVRTHVLFEPTRGRREGGREGHGWWRCVWGRALNNPRGRDCRRVMPMMCRYDVKHWAIRVGDRNCSRSVQCVLHLHRPAHSLHCRGCCMAAAAALLHAQLGSLPHRSASPAALPAAIASRSRC